MSNGACLALTDPRRLSRVKLRAEPEASPPISLLGPDPLTHPLSLETFAAALAKPTAPIKAVLLAQVCCIWRGITVKIFLAYSVEYPATYLFERRTRWRFGYVDHRRSRLFRVYYCLQQRFFFRCVSHQCPRVVLGVDKCFLLRLLISPKYRTRCSSHNKVGQRKH